MSYCRVATLDELWSGEKLCRMVDNRRVLLVNVDGEVCAYEDRCRHKGVPLSEGHLHGRVLTCAAHGWEYDARTGRGINPENVELPKYAVKIEGNDILVEVGSPMTTASDTRDWVGPVLQKGPAADAIVAAIRELNGDVTTVDRGGYLRVLVHRRCRVTSAAIARSIGAPFQLPSDLELVMSSFKGAFEVSEEEAVWSYGEGGAK